MVIILSEDSQELCILFSAIMSGSIASHFLIVTDIQIKRVKNICKSTLELLNSAEIQINAEMKSFALKFKIFINQGKILINTSKYLIGEMQKKSSEKYVTDLYTYYTRQTYFKT